MSSLRPGDPMPAFELPDADGKLVRSADLVGRGPLVVYFYPKDETMVCTAEACAFRDQHADFLANEAKVIGISVDSVDSHRSFAAHHQLPFTLLADPDARVHRLFGIGNFLGLVRGRETFVVDRAGIVQAHCDSHVFASRHVRVALEAVRKLAASPRA